MTVRPAVLVTLEPGEAGRAVLADTLGDVADVVYLGEVPADARAAALGRARVILGWQVERELSHDDWTVLAARENTPGASLFIQLFSAGVDHVPFRLVPAGVTVAGNAGGWSEPMAEHVLGMVLALAKRLSVEHDELRRGVFNESLPTRELRGGTCAIVGFGGVGRAVARLATALGMHVVAVTSSGRGGARAGAAVARAGLEDALRCADVVVLSLPLTASTRGLIGARELGWMRDDAILVNVARGPVVDEAALYHHLRAHPRFSAALDVWWDEPGRGERFEPAYPFLDLPNVLGSPHNSGIVAGWVELGLRRAAENVRRLLLGEPPSGVVRREDYLA